MNYQFDTLNNKCFIYDKAGNVVEQINYVYTDGEAKAAFDNYIISISRKGN